MPIINSLSTFISNIQVQVQSYSPWKKNTVKLKALVQSFLLAASRTSDQPLGRSLSCPNSQLSCHNTTAVDTCCLNYPGGLMLQTQFWDTDPPVGPSDSWTIHGLWPDFCDGTYEANCDRSRTYSNISAILATGGGEDVLSYMHQYWKDYQGDDENLWSHEWSKHGTCVSTLDTKCYTDYKPQQEVVDYFNATVALFKTLPTYQTLAAAGVLPSHSRTWTVEEIQGPLKKMHGTEVTLGCRGKALTEIWYHFSVRGSVQSGEFIATTPDGAKSHCPGTGIRYLPKDSPGKCSSTTRPTGSTSVTQTPSPTSTSTPFVGKGFLQVYVKGEANPQGCLISKGTWYTSGSCAGFRVQDDVLGESATTREDKEEPRLFTLLSSKGPCGIVDDKFQCAKKLPAQTIFSTTSNGTLSFQKHATFYARAIPQHFQREDISTIKQNGEELEVEIVWSNTASHIQAEEDL